MDLEPYGVEGKVAMTPGHTQGSISVILDSGDAIIGDLIMGKLLNRGVPSLPIFADDIDQVRESISLLTRLSSRRIFCSHGGPFSVNEVKLSFFS